MVRQPDIRDVRGMAYFDALTDEEAERFAHDLVARAYGPRELILVEGNAPQGFYYLRKGKARIFRTGTDGREQSFRIASDGDTFAEVPLFDGGLNPATVEALEPSEVVLVPTECFYRAIEQHSAVAMTVLRHFARRIRGFTELVEQLSLQTVQSRLARYLYQLAREEGVEGPDGGIIVRRTITQQDLASLVGSVREVVTRTLKVMEEDGVVEVRRKDILIRDLQALRELL